MPFSFFFAVANFAHVWSGQFTMTSVWGTANLMGELKQLIEVGLSNKRLWPSQWGYYKVLFWPGTNMVLLLHFWVTRLSNKRLWPSQWMPLLLNRWFMHWPASTIVLLWYKIVRQKTLAISVNDGSGTCASIPTREQFLRACVVLLLPGTDLKGNSV